MLAQKRLPVALTKRLRAHTESTGSGVLRAFEGLVAADCSAEWLMRSVAALGLAHGFEAQVHGDPARMDSRKLRSLVEKTRQVARDWEQEFQGPFGKAVLQSAARSDPHGGEAEYRRLPQKLLSLAAKAKTLHRGSSRLRRPLYDDNLASLTEYVNLTTGNYRDSEVARLVWFATGQRYDENTLRVWRHDHPGALKRARLRLRQN